MRQVGLTLLLVLATFGEGGAGAGVLLAWHGLLVALLIVELLAQRGTRGDDRVPDPWARLAAAPFGAVVLIGALLAPYGYAAWLTLLELSAFAGIVFLGARCGVGCVERLALPLMIAANVQSLLAIVQRLLGEPRPAGTFLNPNHLAAWLSAVLLLFWGGRWSRTGSRSWVAWGATLPLIAAVVLTGSRGALLGLICGVATLVALAWPGLSHGRRRAVLGGAAAALLVVGALVVVPRLRESDPFRYQRLRIWRASLQATVDAPWLGTGPNQFSVASSNFRFPDGNGPFRFDRSFSSPHSDLLRVPVELGWPGLVTFVGAAFGLFVSLRRRYREGRLPSAAAGAIAALAALGTQAMVSDLTRRPALYLLGAALLGVLLSVPRREKPIRRPALALTVAGLLILVFLVGDVAPYLAWRGVEVLPRGRLPASDLRGLDRALDRNPIHPDLWLRRAEHLVGDGSSLDAASYAVAREAAERAIRLSPQDAKFRRGAARVEALACRHLFRDAATRARAAERYREAERLSRYDPFIPLELASFLMDTGDPTAARRAVVRALALEPESVMPRLLLADALLSSAMPDAERVGRLLDEAEERSERWRAYLDDGRYAEALLRLDTDRLDRLRGRLAAALPGS